MEFFHVGGAEHERLELVVSGYEREPTGEYHDDNWLSAGVSVSVGKFTGSYPMAILTDELAHFRDELARLHDTLKGEAAFTTLEGQLLLRFTGDGRGHVSVEGEARDRAGIGNALTFSLEIDQTQLAETLEELDAVIARFPVRRAVS